MSNFWKTILPTPIYQRLRGILVFRPDDPLQLSQVAPQFKVDNSGVDRIKGHRYPAPGSQEQPTIPTRTKDQLFDVTFHTRDSRRITKNNSIFLNASNPSMVQLDASIKRPNYNPAKYPRKKFVYDPTGLRSAKSTTLEAVEKALESVHVDHLVRYEWEKDLEAIEADCRRKGIPLVPGRHNSFKEIDPTVNQISW